MLAATLSVASTAGVLGAGPPDPAVAAAPYPIYEVPTPAQLPPGFALPLRSVSRDGRFATMLNGGDVSHFTLPFGEAVVNTPVGRWDPASGGVFGYYNIVGSFPSELGPAVRRWRIATGEVERLPLPPEYASHVVAGVTATDPSGRFLMLDAGASEFGSTVPVLFDTVLGEASTPFGETWVVGSAPVPTGVSRDGRFVFARTTDSATPPRTTFQRLDRSTGVLDQASPPPEADPSRPFVASSNLEFRLFTSSQAGVLPGLDATPRLYLRTRAGSTFVVPIDGSTVVNYTVDDIGRVIVSHVVPTPAASDAVQLSTWMIGEPVELLTVGRDGEPADDGISRRNFPFVVSDDGRRITFTSESANLVAPGSVVRERLFQIVLPRRGPVRFDSGGAVTVTRLVPDESLCTPVLGAVPGEFVGLNVTPVGASAPGFGVVHSSDERARSTSNVNFGPGTVDPNVAFVKVGVDGEVCFTNSRHGAVDVVIDAMTVASAATMRSTVPAGPQRLLDTRPADPLLASRSVCTSSGGVGARDFVGVNITPIGAVAAGFATAHASGSSPGSSSTVNFGPGTVDPNFALVPVGDDLGVCVTNSVHGPVDVLVDLQVVGASGRLRVPTPGTDGGRPVDTRIGRGAPTLGASQRACFRVPGAVAGEAVGVNLTVVNAVRPGFVTLHSSDDAAGDVSSANFGPGTVDPNFAIATVGADDRICVTNSEHGAVDLLVDAQVIGGVGAFRAPTPGGSVRILDTRVGLFVP